MQATFNEVERQARTLSADDRARLAELLLESIQEPDLQEVKAAWDIEIAARVASLNDGSAILYPASEVFAQARKACR